MTILLRIAKSCRVGTGVVLGLLVLVSGQATVQALGGFTVSPSTGNYHVGDTITIDIRENSGTEPTNIVSARLSYPADLLQYVSTDTSQSMFTSPVAEKLETGLINTSRSATAPLTGDQLVQRVTFTAIAPGVAALSYIDGTMAVGSGAVSNVAPGRGTASFTLTPLEVSNHVSINPAPAMPTVAPRGSSSSTTKASETSNTEPATEQTNMQPARNNAATGTYGVGAVAMLAVLACATLWWFRRRRQSRLRAQARGGSSSAELPDRSSRFF